MSAKSAMEGGENKVLGGGRLLLKESLTETPKDRTEGDFVTACLSTGSWFL